MSRTAIMAVVGGTTSKLGGGKFSNGAVTATFVHMFNGEDGKSIFDLGKSTSGLWDNKGQIWKDIKVLKIMRQLL